jgi:hypothetical protein
MDSPIPEPKEEEKKNKKNFTSSHLGLIEMDHRHSGNGRNSQQ